VEEPAVAVETPKAAPASTKTQAATKPEVSAEVELSEVPLKKLKAVQQARVEKAKAELASTEAPKKKQRKTAPK
jgi:hypothetical protein